MTRVLENDANSVGQPGASLAVFARAAIVGRTLPPAQSVYRPAQNF
jgi:hypothetical protein